uniref:THO complex subunit 7 n=1 Tax=Corvus moneduloides TaxID=1196302 RepID=A0A8U7P8M5_CORMO
MGAVTDDEVIRKRLLIDGDGAGDDRRINLLVKSFIKWCNSGSQEEGYSQYQRMLSTLSQCEFSMGKTLLVYDMNLREMENYEKIYKDIENSIAAAHEKISECKKQILQAKRIRKNRQEYDALAKVIQHHPDRHETLKQLEALGKELQNLSHIKENVEDKLELRRKQFHVLLSTIHELQQTLESKCCSLVIDITGLSFSRSKGITTSGSGIAVQLRLVTSCIGRIFSPVVVQSLRLL